MCLLSDAFLPAAFDFIHDRKKEAHHQEPEDLCALFDSFPKLYALAGHGHHPWCLHQAEMEEAEEKQDEG